MVGTRPGFGTDTGENTMRTSSIIAAFMLTLAACGGGGGFDDGGQPRPTGPPPNEPTQPRQSETHRSEWLEEDNSDFFRSWYAAPQIDLPRHGRDGLQVERPPHGGAGVPRLTFSPVLRDYLEPHWRYDNNALARLVFAERLLWTLGNQAYLQWTRHLDYDPGSLALQIGFHGNLTCHNEGIACYVPSANAVVLNDAWIAANYAYLQYSLATADAEAFWTVYDHLFVVLTHEAGHQFGYWNPGGTTDGCGGDRCHAPYGSRSVISYDHLRGRSVRYYVTEEDIRHVPNATWNNDDFDTYTVLKSGEPSSIDCWGVWIDHYFEVDGRTAPGFLWGGYLSIIDEIAGSGWVHGKPSGNVSLTTTATWSGEDNFLGVDLDPDYLGALLRADANLRYTFGNRPNLNLRVNNFEAHYSDGGFAGWHDHNFFDWGDFRYNMDCTPDGCSGENAEAKWYSSDAGDPSGWVGGVVNDQDNAYVGSFVAEKD